MKERLVAETSPVQASQEASPEQGPTTILMDELDPEIIHQAIAKRWRCSCWRRHEAKLRLASCRCWSPSTETTKFDMLFSTLSMQCQWQRAQITLVRYGMLSSLCYSAIADLVVSIYRGQITQPHVSLVAQEDRDENQVTNFITSNAVIPDFEQDGSKSKPGSMKAFAHGDTSVATISTHMIPRRAERVSTSNTSNSRITKFSSHKRKPKDYVHDMSQTPGTKLALKINHKRVRFGYLVSKTPEGPQTSATQEETMQEMDESEERRPVPIGYSDIPEGGICQLLSINTHRSLISLLAGKTLGGFSLSGKFDGQNDAEVAKITPLSSALGTAGSSDGISLGSENIREKLLLANVLAHAIMQLYGSPWTNRQWTKERLCFVLRKNRDSSLKALLELYLSAELDEQANTAGTGSIHAQHSHPRLLELGIMLLEIELGTPIEKLRQASDLGENSRPLANTNILVANRLVRSQELMRTFVDYKRAVMACLNANECVGKDLYYVRSWIKSNIVDPLEQLLSCLYDMTISANEICIGGISLKDTDHLSASIEIPMTESNEPGEELESLASRSFEGGQFLDCERELVSDRPSL